MRSLRWTFLLGLTALLTLAGAGRANPMVIEKLLPGTAYLRVPDGNTMHNGTGVLIDVKERLLLTANHVTGGKDQVLASFPRRDSHGDLVTDAGSYWMMFALRGKVVHRDPGRDLALIQLEKLPEGAQAVPLAVV